MDVVPESSAQLFHPRRISVLFRRDPYVYLYTVLNYNSYVLADNQWSIITNFSTCFRVYTEDTSDILNTALTGIVDPIVYGVFNTPVNAISGSAVCMFNISDVIETFMGSFKDQEAMDSNWLPVKKVWLV